LSEQKEGEKMAFTLEHIEKQIAKAEEALEYWEDLRDMVANPLFSALEERPLLLDTNVKELPKPFPIESNVLLPERRYGLLKKTLVECLTTSMPGMTPQELATKMQERGFVFETKTPAISVNDTLQGLWRENKVRKVGKSASNAGLWVKK
jgi:hypothetical protein